MRGDVAGDQPLTVLSEHRDVPHCGVLRQPDKPAEQQIIVELLHQLPLRTHRIERLQQQRAKQFLRRNRGPAGLGIELLEFRRPRRQRRVDDFADRPQWMIHWHSALAAHIAEQRLCSRSPTAHRTSPNISSRTGHYTQSLGHNLGLFPQPASGVCQTPSGAPPDTLLKWVAAEYPRAVFGLSTRPLLQCRWWRINRYPAREPQHVAEVLAELMGGKCYPFGPLEGAFMAA